MKLFKKAKRGFTLVELVVVIAVIAILAAVSVGAYFGITESANSSRLEQEAKAAHTNIQLVAMNQDDNSNLTREGLYINDLDTFETKMESYSGFHYDIVAQEPSAVNNPTLYFCNETSVSSANIVNQRFNTFKYYNPEVGNKRASVNIPSGDITIEEATFELGDPEPIIIESIEFDGISDTVDNFFVGDRKTFNVVTEPVGLGYTFEIGNNNVVKIEGNEIVAIGAGESKVTVRSENLDSDGNQLTDEITVNVTAVEIVELIVNGFTNEYIENTPIDTEVSYQLKLNNGKTVDVENNTVTISETNATLELTKVQFTYRGNYGEATTIIPVVVNARELVEITASVQTIDTSTYFENDILDISGITFTAHYNNDEIEDISNSIVFDNKLVANQEKITFSYNGKTLDIQFSNKIPKVELIKLECKTIDNSTPQYNVGDSPSKENVIFTAFYNNSDHGVVIDSDEIVIETNNITLETTCINYSYTDKGTKKIASLNISVTDFNRYYFIDQGWWAQDGAVPYMKLYNESKNAMSDEEIGVKMDLIENTLSPLIVSQIYTINIDIFGAKYIQISRGDKSGNLINAKTTFIDISNMTGNAIVLTTKETWLDQSGEAQVTFENYDANYQRNIHIVGINNIWEHSEDTQFSYNSSNNSYYKNAVNLEYHAEFLFKEVHGDGTNEDFCSLIKYNDKKDKITNTNLGLYSSTEFGNFKVGHSAAGVYDIVINSDRSITFNKVSENFDLELRGVFKGVDRWVNNPISYTTRNNNIFVFENVQLQENDEFRIYTAQNYDFEYTYDNININENNRFVDNNKNIKLVGVDGVFTITVDLALDKVDIEEISSNHVHRYDVNSHYCSCNVYREIFIDTTDKNKDGAWFWIDTRDSYANHTHVRGTLVSGNIFKFVIPTSQTNMKIYRMDPSESNMNYYTGIWNTTGDLIIDASKTKFTWTQNEWNSDFSDNTWSIY